MKPFDSLLIPIKLKTNTSGEHFPIAILLNALRQKTKFSHAFLSVTEGNCIGSKRTATCCMILNRKFNFSGHQVLQ